VEEAPGPPFMKTTAIGRGVRDVPEALGALRVAVLRPRSVGGPASRTRMHGDRPRHQSCGEPCRPRSDRPGGPSRGPHAVPEALDAGVGREICELYRSTDSRGQPCDVLYFFGVKCLPCPGCGESVDLFSNYVFATHAYKKENPEARFTCPDCGEVLSGRYGCIDIACGCGARFCLQPGHTRRVSPGGADSVQAERGRLGAGSA
jgi:hypothetical protein